MKFNWQFLCVFQERSSRASQARRSRPRLTVETLETRAMMDAALPAATVESGAALHLNPLVAEVGHVVNGHVKVFNGHY